MPLVLGVYEESTDRYLAMLAKVTPDLTPDVRELRWALARDLTNRLLGNRNGPIHQWLERRAPNATSSLQERLIDVLVGIFSASVTTSAVGARGGDERTKHLLRDRSVEPCLHAAHPCDPSLVVSGLVAEVVKHLWVGEDEERFFAHSLQHAFRDQILATTSRVWDGCLLGSLNEVVVVEG